MLVYGSQLSFGFESRIGKFGNMIRLAAGGSKDNDEADCGDGRSWISRFTSV